MKRLVLTFAGAAAAGSVLLYFAIGLYETGALRAVDPYFKGDCRPIGPIAGAEDLEFSDKHDLYFISSDHRPENMGEQTPNGNIYSLSRDGNELKQLADSMPFEFHPHGLSLLEEGNRTLVWVVNHRPEETTIEVFTYADGKLAHLKTFENELLGNANDIAAYSLDRFFVTRDHQTDSHRAARIYDYLRIGNGSVVSFNGKSYDTRATGLAFANGIISTADGSRLIVAEMMRQRLHIYRVENESGELSKEKTIPLGSSPDNVTWDADGNLWIGTHPNLLKLSAHSRDHKRPSPSVVLRLKGPLSEDSRPEEIFRDDGSHLSAVSVAKRVGPNLVLGTVFDSKLSFCTIASP
ncbi:MAG: SMP-30/gluconolactonase/LRE family protein [Bdellovibrionia bacterium]